MKKLDLLRIIQESFDSAVEWSRSDTGNNYSNSLKSSLFVSNLGKKLFEQLNDKTLSLNAITVTDKGKKITGEWLLDIAITEDTQDGFKNRILWAIESESNCSKKAFYHDFAKLFHINSENYLYLNGLKQKTKKGRDNYIKNRINKAEKLIGMSNKKFWFAFWASPCKSAEIESIWNSVNQNEKFFHLKYIHLFYLNNGKFIEVST